MNHSLVPAINQRDSDLRSRRTGMAITPPLLNRTRRSWRSAASPLEPVACTLQIRSFGFLTIPISCRCAAEKTAADGRLRGIAKTCQISNAQLLGFSSGWQDGGQTEHGSKGRHDKTRHPADRAYLGNLATGSSGIATRGFASGCKRQRPVACLRQRAPGEKERAHQVFQSWRRTLQLRDAPDTTAAKAACS